MHPKLYNRSGQFMASLDNIISETAEIKRVVNGEFTFTFEAYEKELKSEYFDPDNNIVIDGQTFDVKYIEQHHEIEVKYAIQCEHVNYRMEDGEENLYVSYANIGTPTEILTGILFGTGFSVGTVDFTDEISISVNAEVTKKALIYRIVNLLGGEIEYTNQGFTINILNSIGQNNGYQARFGKNLNGISKIIDARGGFKMYYEVDLILLRNSNEYIEKQLQDLEVVGVGDTIRMIDPVIGLDAQNRVLSITYNPIFAINTKLEIANTIEFITDKINQIERSSVKQDTLYNNVAISQDYGFRASRSDQLARATLGGGTISLDAGDGEGNYTPAIYFDAVTKKYRVIGDIIMESGSITWGDVEPPSAEDVGAISDTYIDQYGVFTPKVYAINIDTLYGKIDTAQIENLEVGNNVTMGENAYIAWGKVTGDKDYGDLINRPDISSEALDAIEETYIDIHGVWTPRVYATRIDTSEGRIDTALIEDLIVGDNVTMGANATLSWVNISNRPTIPTQYTDSEALAAWQASNYATHIDSYGVYTGDIIGYQSLGIGAYIWSDCPFRVDAFGNATATSLTLTGSSSINWANVTAPGYGNIQGTKPPTNADNTSGYLSQNTLTALNSIQIGLQDNGIAKTLWFNNAANISTYDTGYGHVGISVSCDRFMLAGASAVDGDWAFAGNVGFYGAEPVTQQTAQLLGTLATTETADGTYSSNEQAMLNHIKEDLLDFKNKMNGALTKLGYYGLFYTYS